MPGCIIGNGLSGLQSSKTAIRQKQQIAKSSNNSYFKSKTNNLIKEISVPLLMALIGASVASMTLYFMYMHNNSFIHNTHYVWIPISITIATVILAVKMSTLEAMNLIKQSRAGTI